MAINIYLKQYIHLKKSLLEFSVIVAVAVDVVAAIDGARDGVSLKAKKGRKHYYPIIMNVFVGKRLH